MVNPLGTQGGTENVGIDVVKATLNIKKQRSDFEGWAFWSTDYVRKGSTGFEWAERGEGATLITVEKANVSGNGRETGGNNPLHDF